MEKSIPKELIHCGECEHCVEYHRVVEGIETKYACALKYENDYCRWRVEINDFCSWGKKRQQGENDG